MIVVSDTSPITNLLKIDRIQLLRDLYQTVIVPYAVSREINFLEENRKALVNLEFLHVVELKHREVYDDLILKELDPGEAEAIALTLELTADVLLMDETDGRREAIDRGLKVTGIIGVLLDAKQLGLIDRVKPEIENLSKKARFWMSPALIDLALTAAGEK
jgi:predicted nucleic acid-binding protein